MAVTYQGKGAYTNGTGALTVPLPSGVAEGDLLILIAEGSSNTPSTPSGWTSIRSAENTSESYKACVRVCYKIAGASEGSVSVADSGDSTRAMVLRITGHDPTTPIGNSNYGTDTANVSATCGFSTTIANSLVMCVLGFNDSSIANDTSNWSSWANSSLASITEGHDQLDYMSSGRSGGIAFAYGTKATAGSVNAFTATSDDGSNGVEAYVTFAVNPLTDQTLALTGIASTAAIGTLTLVPGNVNLALTGIASGAQIGTLTMVPGNVNLALTGIPSGVQFGTLTLELGEPVLVLTGIPSTVQIGTLTLVPGPVVMELSGIPPGTQFGTLTLVPGEIILALAGIASTAQFGELTLAFDDLILSLTGIPSGVVIGDLALRSSLVHVKVSGVWKAATVYAKVGGEWQDISIIKGKVTEIWK